MESRRALAMLSARKESARIRRRTESGCCAWTVMVATAQITAAATNVRMFQNSYLVRCFRSVGLI
jgi:hypothetical protein